MVSWVWTILGGWLWNLVTKWWRARRLAYLKWFREEMNKLLDLTEQAFRESDPQVAKDKVAELIEATAKADPKVVEQVKAVVQSKSAEEPMRDRHQCIHQWDKDKQVCILCGVTFKEYDFQVTENSGLRPQEDD